LFFLCSHHNPRDLHSFPTRRSSDLSSKIPNQLNRISKQFRRQVLPPERLRRLRPRTQSPQFRLIRQRKLSYLRLWLRTWLRKSRDRKSTRLNSSHVAISYAVFCLKK